MTKAEAYAAKVKHNKVEGPSPLKVGYQITGYRRPHNMTFNAYVTDDGSCSISDGGMFAGFAHIPLSVCREFALWMYENYVKEDV